MPERCSVRQHQNVSAALQCHSSIEVLRRRVSLVSVGSLSLFRSPTFRSRSLKCNKIVPYREHVFQHQHHRSSSSTSSLSSSSSGFLIDSIDSSTRSSRCLSPPRVHLIEHQHPNRDYRCTVCNQSAFDDAAQLYHHMVQHGPKARLHPCRDCDVYFMFSMHLINHQYSHADDAAPALSNGNALGLKVSLKAKGVANDDEESSCKSIVTRSSSKATCRSVTVN